MGMGMVNQLHVTFFWDDDVCFVLDQRFELDFYSASSLKQQPMGRHAAPSQPFFALLISAVCLSEQQQYRY
jgi:hypothetical protein